MDQLTRVESLQRLVPYFWLGTEAIFKAGPAIELCQCSPGGGRGSMGGECGGERPLVRRIPVGALIQARVPYQVRHVKLGDEMA